MLTEPINSRIVASHTELIGSGSPTTKDRLKTGVHFSRAQARSEPLAAVPGARKLMDTAFGRDSQGIIACSGDNLRVCKL